MFALVRSCYKSRRLSSDAGPKRMEAGNGNLYPVLGLLSFAGLIIYLVFGKLGSHTVVTKMSFVGRTETQFIVDGRAFYVNGWNSYWLMDQAVEERGRQRVTEMFHRGAKMGLTVCRTWAFNDGTHNALQVSLGHFDEHVFEALDHTIVEAHRHGIRLLLCFVNNLNSFGGKAQYVKWAWEKGIGLSSSNDSFFFDPTIKSYFKLYLKTILTRKNHLNGIEYRDDPTIFAWELINEPQCSTDVTGDTLQDWIEEMARYIKSIDKKHLLTIGHEGFYGPTSPPEKLSINPGEWYSTIGADFIRNFKVSDIDFASVHIYPDHWMKEAKVEEKMEYISKWLTSHIDDGNSNLRKPVMFTEFGLSDKNKDFQHLQREAFYKSILDRIYESASNKEAGAGAFIWQYLVGGMEEYNDDFGVIPGQMPSIDKMLYEQSHRLAVLSRVVQ